MGACRCLVATTVTVSIWADDEHVFALTITLQSRPIRADGAAEFLGFSTFKMSLHVELEVAGFEQIGARQRQTDLGIDRVYKFRRDQDH